MFVAVGDSNKNMGVFHHKAILKEHQGNVSFYIYFPNYISSEDVSGEFLISLNDWVPVIIINAHAESSGLGNIDDRCVYLLSREIKKHFQSEGKFPLAVFHIA